MEPVDHFSIHQLSNSRVTKRRLLARHLLEKSVSASSVVHEQSLQKRYGVGQLKEALHLTQFEQERGEEMAVTFITLLDASYPKPLLSLPTPPFCLRVSGPILGSRGVTIVGARAATAFSMTSSFNISAHLAQRGYHIISGGAYGVDGAAHRGALEAGGDTTVCLGSGLMHPYPERHIPLFRGVVETGGTLLSSNPLNMEPHPGAFIARNAIMAALAGAVIVIAAGSKSGALHTAKFAFKMGIPLFALPGSHGCDLLIRQGAKPLPQESVSEGDWIPF